MAEDLPESKTVTEGKAEVFLPKSVFYNPVQEFNRDLTINVISQYIKELQAERTAKAKQSSRNASVDSQGKKKVIAEENSQEDKLDKTTVSTEKDCPDGNGGLGEGDMNIGLSSHSHIAGQKCNDGVSILEGLAASGLRSMRFAKEIPGIKEIVANDLSRTAVEFIKKNAEHNNVQELVTPSCEDASLLMYQHRKREDAFDVIDLDPYGTASPFLDATVQAVVPGGLLCVTCTDLAILTGSNAPETCHAKYGSLPVKARFCHEMALRILLQCIESHANRYSRYIVPLISISVDFYIRVFVRVYSSAQKVKESAAKMASIYNCPGCGSYHLHRICQKVITKGGGGHKFAPTSALPLGDHCPECSSKYQVGGPIWAEPIHDLDFVAKVLQHAQSQRQEFGTSARIEGMLSLILEELPNTPLYYITDDLCKVVHCVAPTMKAMRSAILNAGYEVSLSHAAKNSLKTTAPPTVLWDSLRCWVKDNPVKASRLSDGSLPKKILSKEPACNISFALRADADPASRKKGLLRYQPNPERDWGPKPRATQGSMDSLEERRLKGVIKAKGKRKNAEMPASIGPGDTIRPSIKAGLLGSSEELGAHVLQPDLKDFPCKKLKKNECDRGEECCYSHNLVPKANIAEEEKATS